MKCFTIVAIFLAGLCGSPAAERIEAAKPDFTRQQVVETWGWIIAQEKNIANIELNPGELITFIKGFSAAGNGHPLPHDSRKIYHDVEKLAKARREKIVHTLTQKNEAEAAVFFVGLKKSTNVVALPGGVYYKITKLGDGSYPKPRQTVNIHYIARLIDGTEFMQFGPIDMVLVTNRSVCRSWFEALQKISKGGAMKLYVPPPLAEEDAVKWGIQPGSLMIFEIELLDVKTTSAEDLENALLPPAPESEPPPPSGFNDSQIIEAWGWSVAQETRVGKYGLSEEEISLLAKGLAAGIRGEPSPYELQKISPAVEQFVADRREKVRRAERKKKVDEMNAFFAELKKNTNIVELPDGLRYEIIKPGGGSYPKPGQIVLVDYTARLIDGTLFDKTYNEPLNIEVGAVIPGWNEAIQKINKGGRIKFYIPPSLGYGEVAVSGVVSAIPANSTLIYDLELLDIKDALPSAASEPEKE